MAITTPVNAKKVPMRSPVLPAKGSENEKAK